jgi:transcriptional regulator with XRE-family HTH domain
MPTRETIFDKTADVDTLGNRIKRARIASGQEVSHIAKTLGVRKSSVEGWENDKAAPRTHHLLRIAGMVGVSPSWLLGGVGEAPDLDGISDEIQLIRKQLVQIKAMRDQTTEAIENIEVALDRLVKKEVG